MAIGAQGAAQAEPERHVVAAVRFDMIGDGRRRDVAGVEAEPPQRLDHELVLSAA